MKMTSGRVQYEEVAARLRDEILGGRHQPGSRLPTERHLCELLGVSRITIRQALAILAEERLIERRQGSGTYVSPRPSRRIPLRIDYTGSMRQHAPRLSRTVAVMERRVPSRDVARELGLEEGDEVLYAERRDMLADRAVAWDEAFIAPGFARRLGEEMLGRVDFMEAWMQTESFSMQSCRQVIEARPASLRDISMLALPEGSPVLISTELYIIGDGRSAGLFISHYHPEHICIQSRYDWRVDVLGQTEA